MTISNPRIEVKDAPAAGWFGAREEGALPVRAGAAAKAARGEAAPRFDTSARAWLRRGRRAVLDLALVLAAMTAVPVLLVWGTGDANWRAGASLNDLHARTEAMEASRQFALPKDPAITPLEAGRALFALSSSNPPPMPSRFQRVGIAHPDASWRTMRITAGMFPTARPRAYWVPNSETILEAVAKGFSADEMSYLKRLASSPAWREYDRVARAGSVDIVGGEFVLPFPATTTTIDALNGAVTSTKEMAYAAVSRAAYQMAIGRLDSAETILRSIISFGFNLSDNAARPTDQLIGRFDIEVGRDALQRFFALTRDPRAATVAAANPAVLAKAASPAAAAGVSPGGALSVDRMREELIKRAENPAELRDIRFNALQQLAFSSCTNVRDLLLGERADVTQAFEAAKRDLARYPSELALIDVLRRTPSPDRIATMGIYTPVRKVLIGASMIAGSAFGNPRLATCAWYTTEGRMGF